MLLREYTVVQRIAYQPPEETFTFITPMGFQHPMTRVYARLLGPCFKTGRRDDQLLHRGKARALEHRQDQPPRPSRMRPTKGLARQYTSASVPNHKSTCTENSTPRTVGSKSVKTRPLPTVRRTPTHASAHIARKCTSHDRTSDTHSSALLIGRSSMPHAAG